MFRFNANGTLDKSFGVNGAAPAFKGDAGTVTEVLPQPGGKMIVAGSFYTGHPGPGLFSNFIVRLTAGGQIDPTFGVSGGAEPEHQQPDGLLGVRLPSERWNAGRGRDRFAARPGHPERRGALRADGKLNTAFGSNGLISLSSPDIPSPAVQVEGDGKILVSGLEFGADSGTHILRFNADGSPDKTFNGGADVVLPLAGDPDTERGGVSIQPDGELLVTQGHEDGVFEVARLNGNGTFDTAFGKGGDVTVTIGVLDGPPGVLLLPDGKLLLYETSIVPSQNTFSLFRLTATGALDPSFGTAGRLDTVFPGQGPGQSPPEMYFPDLVLQPDGKAVVVGSALDSSGTFIAMARYQLDDSAPVPASSTTTLSAPAAAPYGQAVTLTGTVTGAGKPTGTVTFLDGTTMLGSATVGGNGKAQFSAAHLGAARINSPRDTPETPAISPASPPPSPSRWPRRPPISRSRPHRRVQRRTNRDPYRAGRLIAPGRPAGFRDGHVHGGGHETGRGRGHEGERRGESQRPGGGQAHDRRFL